MHILIVDDDTKIRELLKKYLLQQGFQTSGAESAEAAQALMKFMNFDVIILDVMMVGMDGVSFANEIRQNSTVPIIMLTARGSVDDRLLGLEAGVDDFMTKPFDPRELVLRIKAVTRRVVSTPTTMSARKFGDFVYEIKEGRLWRSGEAVDLTRSERALLTCLVENFGEEVTRLSLAKAAHLDGDNSRAVDVQITRLRKKLEPNPKSPAYLHSIRGIGYILKDV